jgi:hypothetical protein
VVIIVSQHDCNECAHIRLPSELTNSPLLSRVGATGSTAQIVGESVHASLSPFGVCAVALAINEAYRD